MNICRYTAPVLLRTSGYGAFLRYLEETEANQWKTGDELKHMQWVKLRRLLEHCARHVPYYQKMFQEKGIHWEDLKSFDDFSRLPVLTRKIVGDQGDATLTRGVRKEDLILRSTSGSTGEPTITYYDRDKMLRSWAYDVRHNRWAGYEWGTKIASYWTVYPERSPQRDILTPLRKLKKYLQGHARTIKIDPRDATEEERLDFLRQIKSFKPKILEGYAYGLHDLAMLVERDSIALPPVPAIIPGAEALSPAVRTTLERVFQGTVFNRYGSTEVEIIASECPHHSMHTNDDNLLIELVDTPDGDLAKVVITDLHNYAMPLIRYDLNDYARWADRPCACGRGLAVFSRLDGRTSDLFKTKDNRLVTGLSLGPDVEKIIGVQLFQLIQKEHTAFHLFCVADRALNPGDLEGFHARLKKSFGPETLFTWEIVEEIPRTAGGKHKFYLSEVT